MVSPEYEARGRRWLPGETMGGGGAIIALLAGLSSLLRRYEAWIVGGLLTLGLMLRVLWVLQGTRLHPFVHEMQRAAASFARTGMVGDAYFVGQGPTAHVGPIMPVLGGTIYRLAGVGTPTAEGMLFAVALAFLVGSLVFYYLAFRELKLPTEWRLAALAAAALLPLNFGLEVRDMRLFEGAFASALLGMSLFIVLRMDRRPTLDWRHFISPALWGGFLFLLNPPAALGAYAALALVALKRVPMRRWAPVALVMATGLLAVVGPWTLRNARVMHSPIVTRSNFGLEYAIGFHPAAVSPSDPRALFVGRLNEVHPSSSPRARAEVGRDGELAYIARLQATTRAWVSAHPREAAHIALRHAGEFWFPPRWMWRVYEDSANGVAMRQMLVWSATFMALCALAWRLFREPFGRHLYVACVMFLPFLPYVLVQPILRYRYLIVVVTLFLAAELASRLTACLVNSMKGSK